MQAAMFELMLQRGAEPFDIQVLHDTHFSSDMLWWLELVYKHTINTDRGDAWKGPGMDDVRHGRLRFPAPAFSSRQPIKKRNRDLAEWVLAHGANPNAAPAAR